MSLAVDIERGIDLVEAGFLRWLLPAEQPLPRPRLQRQAEQACREPAPRAPVQLSVQGEIHAVLAVDVRLDEVPTGQEV